jgi:hypothetical protein
MTPTAPAPAEPMGDEELTSAIRDLPDLQRGDDPNGYVTDILESCRSRIDAERARADAAEAARDAALAQDQAFRTRIWEIIDRDGLNNVPSDEIGAIARLVELAARPALPAPVLMETVEQVEALPLGHFLVYANGEHGWQPYERAKSVSRIRFFASGVASPWRNELFVGAYVIRLPDLPIPTPSP